MADEVVLLGFWPSTYALRLRIALAEKGIKYEYKEEDVYNIKSQLLLESNPVHKKIPVLIHNGKPVNESLIALQYIDETWNDKAPLLPSDPYLRSQARFWADFVDNKVAVFGRKIWMTKGDEQEEAKKGLLDCLELLEGELGEKPYFGGEALGFVDVALVPFYNWFSMYEKFGNFSIEAERPQFVAWGKRCMLKESVSKSLPDQQKLYDFFPQYKRIIGIE
ncbi:probable glutathione S-transferase isoform X1 [Argentina anserina]|uniref:probable glutathione S-transferase isoform X1 n=1 Tax=Argentina anserina TaxID=57926 RepID=UPI0021765C49|nr:probable glutathione S-transferase isoform X1 [Potentilla anserina]